MSVIFSTCFADPTLSEWSYVHYAAGAYKLSGTGRGCNANRCLTCSSDAPLESGVQKHLPPDKTAGSFRYQLAIYNPDALTYWDNPSNGHVGIGYYLPPEPDANPSFYTWGSLIVRSDRSLRTFNQVGDVIVSAPGVYPALDGAWHGVQLPFRLYTLNDGWMGSLQGYIEVAVVVDNVEIWSFTHALLSHAQEYWNVAVFNGRRGSTNSALAISCLEIDDSQAVVDWPACAASPIVASTVCGDSGVIPPPDPPPVVEPALSSMTWDCVANTLTVTGTALDTAGLTFLVTAPDGTFPAFTVLSLTATEAVLEIVGALQNGEYCMSLME